MITESVFCNGREVRVQNDSTIDGKIRNAGRRDDEIDFFLVEYVMLVNYPAGYAQYDAG